MARLWLVLAALWMASCGNSESLVGGGGDSSGEVLDGTVTLLTSNPSLSTASDSEVTITAIVKDTNNNVLEGVSVGFSATSGSLAVTQRTTDKNGQALASLFPGTDLSNRTITITADAEGVGATVDVVASGTAITVSGSSSLVAGPTDLALTLTDANGNGIPNQDVTVTMGNDANTISAAEGFRTDTNGQIKITLEAAASDTITASALGASASFAFTVSDDFFSIAFAGNEIPIETCSPVTVTWEESGVPVVGQTVSFSTTRGTFYGDNACVGTGGTVITDAQGQGTVYIRSPNPGVFDLTATGSGVSTTGTAEFIATDPATVTFQAERTTIGPNESVALTAIVRDANNNLVKNADVAFNIAADSTGGSISPGRDTTDSLGRAQTVYTSTDAASSSGGIEIKATVGSLPSETVNLTVAESSLFVTFGMANVAAEETAASYAHPGTVFVTDASGNAVGNVDVTLSVIPVIYWKGWREWNEKIHAPVTSLIDLDGDGLPDPCLNEDFLTGTPAYDGNGYLDPGEDFDRDGYLSPRNVASVDQTVTTNDNGLAEFYVRYAKDNADWVQVRLVATARVGGSESAAQRTFYLVSLASDVSTETKAPPGDPSPFGVANSCDDPS